MPDGLGGAITAFVTVVGARRCITTTHGSIICRYGVLPAQPPFPSCVYFPFQPAMGSHTANLICESEVGRMIPVTSHRAGASAMTIEEVLVA